MVIFTKELAQLMLQHHNVAIGLWGVDCSTRGVGVGSMHAGRDIDGPSDQGGGRRGNRDTLSRAPVYGAPQTGLN